MPEPLSSSERSSTHDRPHSSTVIFPPHSLALVPDDLVPSVTRAALEAWAAR